MGALSALGSSRFLIRRCLGSGGFGTVYEARDTKRNATVAIKVLHSQDPDGLYRFKREFRAVSDVSHPNLVTLYELAADGADWFISMELLDGIDVLSYVRGARPDTADSLVGSLPRTISSAGSLDDDSKPGWGALAADPAAGPACHSLDVLVRAFVSLSQGLTALHRAGHLHRDIKPRNVLCTWTGRVVLLDFGLAGDLALGTVPSTGHAVGTPNYMSPEQAEGLPLTTASDWYSVGVLFYEALAGSLPFAGTPNQVLRRKIAEEAPPPVPLRPDTPHALLFLCGRLLARQPSLRPGGEEVLAVLGALQAGEADLGPEDSPEGAPPRPAPFIGRGPQLAALHQAYQASRQGRAVVALCHGESGAGKSTLCQRFLRDVAEGEDRAMVLDGRCYEHEDVPFKALDGVVDALAAALKRRPGDELAMLLPKDVAVLARLFPVLLHVPEIQAAPVPGMADEGLVRQMAFAALRELLLRLSERHPVVLCIDDLQWGDMDGTALLLQVLAPPDPPPVLVVVSYRSEEQASSPALQLLHQGLGGPAGASLTVREVRVAGLSATEAQALALALLPAPDPARAAGIAAESGGNPLFVTELSRFVPMDTAPGPTSVNLDQIVRARVARLPEDSRHLLEIIAVAGRPIARATAARAALGEGGEADEPKALALLRTGHLVRVGHASSEEGSAREELLPYHDRVREAVVDGLSAADLADHHLRLGQTLLDSGQAEPERLFYHFQGGGDTPRAARYAVLASAEAQRALAFEQVVRLCQAALSSGALRGEEAHEARARLAEALAAIGRPRDAADAYLALAQEEGPRRALDRRRQAARQLMAGGYVEEGMAVLRQLLAAVGLPLPRSRLRIMAAILFSFLLLHVRGRRFRERPESEVRPGDVLRLETCEAFLSTGSSSPLLIAYYVMKGIGLSLRIGEPGRIAAALCGEAMVLSMLGASLPRVRAALARARPLAERAGSAYALGSALVVEGHALHMAGSWRESSRLLTEAREFLRRATQAIAQRDLIAVLLALNLRYLGDLPGLAKQVPLLLREAREHGRRTLEASVRMNSGFLVDLQDDDPDRAEGGVREAERQFAGRPINMQHFFALDAHLTILLYRGCGMEAWEVLQERRKSWAQSGVLRMPFFNLMFRNLQALVALCAGQPPRIAEAAARRLLRAQAVYAAPMAKLILALCQERRGRRGGALALAAEAEAGFDAAGMSLHAAGVRLRRGEWLGGDEGARLCESARAFMAAQGIRNPERMASMLAPR